MTERLYENDSYTVSFDAEAITVREGDGVCYVTLDRTYFFPEEGGQSCDRGTIDGLTVTDVQIKDGEIIHTVAGTVTEGTKVHGEVDWEYRFRNMQMHSGEHVFSGLVYRIFGYSNVGFHLSDRSATMDYNGKLTADDIAMLEEKANRIITEGHAIHAWVPSKEELEKLSYRSKKAIEGDVRLVEIEGVDLCACCVPHVRSTSEIGFLKIVSLENYKGGVRVSYRCGLRALEHYRECLGLLSTAGRLLSSKQEEIPAALGKALDDAKELAFRLNEAERKLVKMQIDSRTSADSKDVCPLFFTEADPGLLRFMMDEARRYYTGVCVVFAAQAEGRFRYLMEGNECVTELQKELKDRFGAKGGGAAGSINGSVCAGEEELRAFFFEHGIA